MPVLIPNNGSSPRVLVVGAGMVGLTTALRLQEQQSSEVTVLSEAFSPSCEGSYDGGLFHPAPTGSDAWTEEAWRYFWAVREEGGKGVGEHGVMEVPMYQLASEDPSLAECPFLAKHSSCHRKVTQNELDLFRPKGKWNYGTYSHTLVVDREVHVRWALGKFMANGGKLRRGRVDRLEDLVDSGYDLIVNCTSLGATKNNNSSNNKSVRGQVLRVKAPWMKMIVCGDKDTYVIPGIDHVVLGGQSHHTSTNNGINPHDIRALLSRATSMVPSLVSAEVMSAHAGMNGKPGLVRLEKERLAGGRIKVVHHYGHCGILTAPGSALTAAQMAMEMLQEDKNNNNQFAGSKL